jgi:hypothetical protein
MTATTSTPSFAPEGQDENNGKDFTEFMAGPAPTLAQVSAALTEQNAINAATGNPPVGKPIPLSKVNQEVLYYFLELRKVAVEESITATVAIQRAMDNFPTITRKDLKHAAAAAGINPLTARNTFDRIKAAK